MPPDNLWESTAHDSGFRQFNQAITDFPTVLWLMVFWLAENRYFIGVDKGGEEKSKKGNR